MKNRIQEKRLLRIARRRRVRARIFGTAERPRLSVFRSHAHIYAQLIDDVAGRTLAAVSDFHLKAKESDKAAVTPPSRNRVSGARKAKTGSSLKKSDSASAIGEMLAKLAKERKIKKVVFDRGGFAYHGRIKALADAARKAGLEF